MGELSDLFPDIPEYSGFLVVLFFLLIVNVEQIFYLFLNISALNIFMFDFYVRCKSYKLRLFLSDYFALKERTKATFLPWLSL